MVASLPAFAFHIPFSPFRPYPWVAYGRRHSPAGTVAGYRPQCLEEAFAGRRIHGSVEDTNLSTNKQHTLSLTNINGVSPRFCAERWRLKQPAGWYATLGSMMIEV